MTPIFRKKSDVVSLISSLVSSLFIYSVLSYLLVTQRIAIPVSIIMFTFIFGLTRYYSKSYSELGIPSLAESSQNVIDNRDEKQMNESTASTILFAAIFAILIIICAFISKANSSIFIPWTNFDWIGVIQLGAAIALAFFVPGYAILLIISKSYKINPVLRVLLAYLFSILVTGLTAYVASSFLDVAASVIRNLLSIIYLVILVAFVFRYPLHRIRLPSNIEYAGIFVSWINTKLWSPLKRRSPEILVFGSLLALLITSTYYLYGGITIGDQWFHQGRALLFMSGSFREATLHDAGWIYPPFQSALLAALTSLSGVPLVNAYASIAFLNITPVFAFYYFFSKWVPRNLCRAGILACSLFAIGSGFNWFYFLGPTAQPIFSEHSFLEALYNVGTVVIVQPTNFIFAANPDFSTGLIYLALPAGFVLLGVVRERIESKFIYTTIVTATSIIGILSHDEFYLFIIVGSFLPLFFKVKSGSYVYLGFLFAFVFVYLLDLILPGKYYTSNVILGLPLLLLSILLLAFTSTLYLIGQSLTKSLKGGSLFLNKLVRKLPKKNTRRQFLIGVFIVFGVTYMFGLSLIVWAQISIDDVKIQTDQNNVPWYLYPMKLGLAGILGLAFILSYFFKRFEKEIFVFGLIIVIALITGPYYDEHRFGKYVMAGMIGFASLLIYKILNLRYHNKEIVNGFLIPLVITCACLSVVMFIGYNSLVLQNHDYSHNPKKNFPSLSEIHMFDILRNKIAVNSTKYNVVTFPNEYRQGYLITRLQAFSGFPGYKLIQSPLTLNASRLDSFYRLLDYSDARYILIPKNSTRDGIGLSEPIRFALNYFPITYEDDNYIVLEVPSLRPPSSTLAPEVALIYDKDDGLLSSEVLDKKLLHYSNETFNVEGKTQFVNIQKDNQTERTILYGNKRDEGITLWSKNFKPGEYINYIQVRFRIISENESISNDGGLQWKEAGKQYYASLSRNGITLSQKQIDNKNDTKIQFQNAEIQKKDGVWYTLKIQSLANSINLYVDDLLKIQVPRLVAGENLQGISNVGISSFRNIAEFGPVEIGRISDRLQNPYTTKNEYGNYYYPLSALALSKAGYDTFMDGDLSALAKKDVILPYDPVGWNDVIFNKYLDYVRAGRKLIIIDPDNNFKGRFSKLFSIQFNDNQSVAFTNIVDHKNNDSLLNISGVVKKVYLRSSPDENVIASYRDEANQTAAPFAIEKHFSNGGKIILLNGEGYFNAISKSPRQYFLSLSNISRLLDLDSGGAITTQSTTTPAKGFIGDLKISGNVTIRSSSLSLINEIDNGSDIYAGQVSISTKNEKLKNVFNNVSIKDLKLVGQYEIMINSTGIVALPAMASQDSYFSTSIPTGFNMTVRLLPNRLSSAEISLNDSSLKLNDSSIINFYKIRAGSLGLKTVPVLLKTPEIKVNGLSNFKAANLDGFVTSSSIPLKIEGLVSAKLDFVDHYHQAYSDGTKTQYITYLQSFSFNGTVDRNEEPIRLAGDISPSAKQQGLQIPLTNALSSVSNIVFLASLVAVTVIGSRLIWPKVKFIM